MSDKKKIDIIEIDEALILRRLVLSDAEDLFNLINTQREYLGEWLLFVKYTREIADTEKFINSNLKKPEKERENVFAVVFENETVGIIGTRNTDLICRKTEIGYWLSQDKQKRGIITRSVMKLSEYLYNHENINRIQIKCATGNIPSRNIPAKCGYTLEGVERAGELMSDGRFVDLEVYSRLKTDKFSR